MWQGGEIILKKEQVLWYVEACMCITCSVLSSKDIINNASSLWTYDNFLAEPAFGSNW